MKKMLIMTAAIMLLFGLSACEFGINNLSGSEILGGKVTAKATDYSQDWKNGGGSYTWDDLGGDSYKIEWSCPGNVDDFVMVVGKGWTSGSANRVIRYYGNFQPDPVTYNDGSYDWENAYLALYGWAHHGGEIIEYYVLENYGEYYHGKPESGDTSYDTIGSEYSSNGSTYHIVTKQKNDYHAFGNTKADFRQIVSIRHDRNNPGNVDGIINFNDHLTAWSEAGYGGLNLDGYQMLAVEANNSNGEATITVDECSQPVTGGSSGNQRFRSEFTIGGEKYLARMTASNFWQSANLKNTHRVGWISGNDNSSNWQTEAISGTDYYYIKNAADEKYLTITVTTTDPDDLVNIINNGQIVQLNLYANPLFTDIKSAGNYGFKQHWLIETSGGEAVLKSRVNENIAISLNGTSGYAQGVTLGMLASKAIDVNTLTFYEKWTIEDNSTPATVYRLRCGWVENGNVRYLTLSDETEYGNRLLKGQPKNDGWNTQLWKKHDIGGGYYRFESLSNNQYLTIRSDQNDCSVICQPLNNSWGSQKWFLENAGNGAYRLRTEWMYNRALNCSDNSTYAPVRNHDVVGDWDSMKWFLEPVY